MRRAGWHFCRRLDRRDDCFGSGGELGVGSWRADVGAVVFTVPTYQIAIDKADRIKETIEAGGETVLEYVDTPVADTSTRMGR